MLLVGLQYSVLECFNITEKIGANILLKLHWLATVMSRLLSIHCGIVDLYSLTQWKQ
jgi:hypothetical protein